ncbi:DUF3405 domain-containing protein [Sphingosinicellaceae bacterium]|nr:DUF3405 domain-containing protein [Sphingosinicellaceae bacterium]
MTSITVTSTDIGHISIGRLTAKTNAAGTRVLRYYIDLRHTKLNLHKELSATEISILQSKVNVHVTSWDVKSAQDGLRRLLQSGKEAADEATVEAGAAQEGLSRIWARTLSVDDAVDWYALKDRSAYAMPARFSEPKPVATVIDVPVFAAPKVGIADRLLGRKQRIMSDAEEAHAASVSDCRRRQSEADAADAVALAGWQRRERKFWALHREQEQAFLSEQAANNAKIDGLRSALKTGEPEAVGPRH